MPKSWIEGKKSAISLCFDVDATTIWKLRAADYPNGDEYIRSLSIGEYGIKRGVDTILKILSEYDIKATFFVPAVIMQENSEIIKKIKFQGHEIAHHGYLHEYSYGTTSVEQLKLINDCQNIFFKVLGEKAVGFRPTGQLLPETVLALEKQPDNLYLITEKGKEIPYYKKVNNQETTLVELPARIEFDDYYQLSYNFYPPQPGSLDRIASYEDVLDNLKREVDGAYQYGACCITAFHPQVLGTPGKSLILRQLIEYIQTFPDIWIGPCQNLAQWWKENN